MTKKMKYTRDNYTLEQLEPRLMMDGAIDDMEGQEPPYEEVVSENVTDSSEDDVTIEAYKAAFQENLITIRESNNITALATTLNTCCVETAEDIVDSVSNYCAAAITAIQNKTDEVSAQDIFDTLVAPSTWGDYVTTLESNGLQLSKNLLSSVSVDCMDFENVNAKLDLRVSFAFDENGLVIVNTESFSVVIDQMISDVEMNIGLFKGALTGGNLHLLLDANSENEWTLQISEGEITGDAKIIYTDVNSAEKTIDINGVSLKYLNNEGLWSYSSNMEKYTSITGSSIINELDIVVMALDNAVQKVFAEKIDKNFSYAKKANLLGDSLAKVVRFTNELKKDFDEKLKDVDSDGGIVAKFTNFDELNEVLMNICNLEEETVGKLVQVTENESHNLEVTIRFEKTLEFLKDDYILDLSKALKDVEFASSANLVVNGNGTLGFTVKISFNDMSVDEKAEFNFDSNLQNESAVILSKGSIYLPTESQFTLKSENGSSETFTVKETGANKVYESVLDILTKNGLNSTSNGYSIDSTNDRLVVYSDSKFALSAGDSNGNNAGSCSILGLNGLSGHSALLYDSSAQEISFKINNSTYSFKSETNFADEKEMVNWLNDQFTDVDVYQEMTSTDDRATISSKFGIFAITLENSHKVMIICDSSRVRTEKSPSESTENVEELFKNGNSDVKYVYLSSAIEYKTKLNGAVSVALGDSQSFSIDPGISTYRSLNLLASEINKNLENKGVTAVVAENNLILKTSSKDMLSVSIDDEECLEYSDATYEFMVNDIGIDVNLDSCKTIGDVVNAVNTALAGSGAGVELKNNLSNGYLSLTSNAKFNVSSVLNSKLLSFLGFGQSCESSEYMEASGNKSYYINGAQLGSNSLNNRFSYSLDKINVNLSIDSNNYAILDLTDESDLQIHENICTVLNLGLSGQNKLNDCKFVVINGEYYKVIENSVVQNENRVNLNIDKISLNGIEISTPDFLAQSQIKIVNGESAISLNANFVEASVFATGKFDVSLQYRNDSGEDFDAVAFFGKVNTEIEGSLNLDASLQIGNTTTMFNVGDVLVDNGKISTDGLSISSCALIDSLSTEFSVESLYSMLKSLAESVQESINKVDVKIPLVNKNVAQLVTLGEDLADIIDQLQGENITSVQVMQQYLNTYLLDAKLISKENNDEGFLLHVDKNNKLAVKILLRPSIARTSSFSFGSYLNGRAEVTIKGSLELQLNGYFSETTFLLSDRISLKSEIELSVDKPSFDLNVAGLESSVLHVGTDKQGNNSSIGGKIVFDVGCGEKEISFAAITENSFDFGYDFDLGGKLHVYTGDIYLGALDISKYVNGKKQNQTDGYKVESDIFKDGIYQKLGGEFFLRLNSEQTLLDDTVFVADFTEITANLENIKNSFTQGSIYEKLKLAVSGLDSFLDIVDSSMNDGLMTKLKSIPVAGKTLGIGADFIAVLHDKIVDPLAKLVYSSPDLDAKSMATQFAKWLKEYLDYKELTEDLKFNMESIGGDWITHTTGVYYRVTEANVNSTEEKAEWFFNLGGKYEYGQNLDFDLGYPGLGISAKGGVDLNLLWSLNFGIGVSSSKGFYLILPEGNELNVKIQIDLGENDSRLYGKIAGLGASLKLDGENNAEASMGIDLNKYENPNETENVQNVTVGEILSQCPDFNWNADVNLNCTIEIGVASTSDISLNFPKITGKFDFAWGTGKSDTSVAEISKLGFSGLKIDLGNFVNGTVGSFISKINSVLEPVQPLINFLTSPFPVLDDLGLRITPLELAKSYDSDANFDFIYAMQYLLTLAKKIENFNSKGIEIPDLLLITEEMDISQKGISNSFLKGSGKASAIIDNLSSYINASEDLLEKLNLTSLASIDDVWKSLEVSFDNSLESIVQSDGKSYGMTASGGGWSFFWDNPKDIYKLFLGQDLTLVKYDMPTLDFNFNWDEFFRIWGPLGVRTGITFGAKIDFSFGYDTLGIRQWVKSDYRDSEKLLNGFFVDNSDGTAELTFYGGLSASAEFNAGVRAGVGGGVNIDIYLDMNDPNKDGKVRLSEIQEILKQKNAMAIFNVDGEITAQLNAYVKLLFYTKRWDITSKMTLFSFKVENKLTPVMASQSGVNVIANVGDNAENRIAINADNQTLTDGENVTETVKFDIGGNKVSWDGGSATVGENGKLLINSGAGVDIITLKSKGADCLFDIIIDAGDGDDVIDLSDLLMAEGQYVIIYGGAGNDRIKGAKGKNIIFGDNGTVIYDENGNVVAAESYVDSGIAGIDLISLDANIDSTSEQSIVFGGAGDDQIAGGAGNDILIGDGGRVNVNSGLVERTSLSAIGGNDLIYGGAGNDLIYGGAGDDDLEGGEGNDTIYGEVGNDILVGGAGSDTIRGGDGMDVIAGDIESDFNVGATFGAAATNKLSNEFKDAHGLTGSNKTISLTDFNSEHFVDPVRMTKSLDGDVQDDHLYGDEGQDVILAGAGKDYVEGGMGNDLIHGGEGNDVLFGGLDNDIVYGGDGDDKIYGESGDDILYGDNGIVSGYSEGTAPYLTGEITFGTNLGLNNGIDVSATSIGGGNDQIFTGSGMDFADGQGGNDEVTVEFMGDSSVSYANILDTGATDGDSLIVNGTNYNDKLLIRASDNGLGFVALLKNESDESNAVKNTNIERVNFWKKSDLIQVNALDGNDSIYIDGTVADTYVSGGTGDDSFLVGQLYQSERDANANVAENDIFATVKTSDGYIGVGVASETTLTLDGDEGKDSFNYLHALGDVTMRGGSGNDDFTVNGLEYDNGTNNGTLENGNISIDGGADYDTLTMNGTRGDDRFVVTAEGVASDIAAVDASGIEGTSVNAGDGDDVYYITGTGDGSETVLNGGNGNDTFAAGGAPEQTFKSTDKANVTKSVTFSIDEEKVIDSFTVVDTEIPAIYIQDTENNNIDFISMTEGSVKALTVGYAGKIAEGESIKVTVSIPRISKNAVQSGNRGIGLSLADDGTYSNTVELEFDANNTSSTVYVHALKDVLTEGAVTTSLTMKAQYVTNAGETSLKKPTMSVEVLDSDSTDSLGLIARTDSYEIDCDTCSVTLENGCNDICMVTLDGYDVILSKDSDYETTGNVLRIINETVVANIKNLANDGMRQILNVHYRTGNMDIAGSSINLAYGEYNGEITVSLNENVVPSKDDLQSSDAPYYYVLNGSTISFYSTSTNRLVSVEGNVSVSGTTVLPTEDSSKKADNPTKSASLSIVKNTRKIYESSIASFDAATVESASGVTYTITLNRELAKDETATVKMEFNLETGLYVVGDGVMRNEDGSYSLVFTGTEFGETLSKIVTVYALNGSADASSVDGKTIAAHADSIGDIRGAVITNGFGANGTINAGKTVVLEYNHLIQGSENEKALAEPETNVRRVGDVFKSDSSSVSSDGPSDAENQNVDRLLVNNQDSATANSGTALSAVENDGVASETALRFTNTDLGSDKGIVANEMEFAEFNLGSGVDNVSISKSLYREDNFQTFTVVNTGKGNDRVTVNKYGETDGQLVVNTEDGNDVIDASSENVSKNGLVAFGGDGEDSIDVNMGAIAFGDKGNIIYKNEAGDVVTNLGYDANGEIIRTRIQKDADGKLEKQTDGIVRGPTLVESVDTSVGGVDQITAGGQNSVVVGGAEKDEISITGDNNIALGDNGRIEYNGLELSTVFTISDSIGGVDNISISGDKNVAMGGAAGDEIEISGSDNVAIGDGGRYTVTPERLYAESKNEGEGGQDYISTGDGKNAIIGGTDKDTIRTGTGNDAIVGDGGKVIMDLDRNALMVANEGFNVGEDLGTAGADDIDAGDGDNVIFGGLGNDDIRTGRGKDVVFGDNGFATFRGNASEALSQVHDTQAVPEIRDEATLSFNFVGNSQTGVPSDSETEAFGADGFAAKNWNNIGGILSGTYGNDDREIVRFDDGSRASAVSVSFGGIERHRTTGTDNRINLQGYSHNFANSSTDANAALMNSGLMTTAPNSQNENKLEVSVDGLAQYFTHYSVIVYLDLPDSHSADTSSIRKVSLFLEGSTESVASYFVNDAANHNFNGSYDRGTATSAELATSANYVVFDVAAGTSIDRFRVVIEEAFPGQSPNGKNLPGIAAIQVNGSLHAQDVAASSDIAHGGDDTISTGGGDDIVVGGTGGDKITTYGDERYGIYDNDVVFGDNAKMVFTDRDNSGATASMLSMAESLDSRDIEGNYADRIITGNGNDVVVGGLGADYIDSGATADADSMLDGIKVVSFNFTRENATAVEMVAPGEYIPVLDDNNHPVYENGEQKFDFIPHETAGVVADNDWTNLYIKNNRLHIVGENENNSDTPVKHDGVGISLVAYDTAVGNGTQNSSLMLKDDAQLDGDTSNSRLFNAYYAAQQQQEIKLTLTGLDTFRTGSELGASAACDVYVYLGGDQQGVDSYNYLFDVCGRQPGGNALDQHYYLNDWTGNHFDGDYRQVTCSNSPTREELLSQVAPDMSLIGNYVVFRNVTSATFEVRIRNLFTDTNQWPLNLPVITAVQVVAVADREDDIAVGGDHDKDLVFGDDACVTFDIDLPFARNENQADYANRAVEAQSIHIDGNAVEIPLDGDGKPVEMGDTILTGRDRDVIVGGDFGDTITMGDGDDVALGDNASLILEHNNPVGVFAPSVEIMLEQHSVNTSNGEVFLGNDNTQASQIQSKFENGGVPGVNLETSANGGTDTFTDATGKDWTLQQEVTPGTVSRIVDISSGAQVVTFVEGETVLLVSDTWPGDQWWHPNIVMVADGQGHSVPALDWEWDVNGSTMTASTQEGYYFTVDIPDTPNGDNRYEIRVTALAAGAAVISIGM